MEQREEMVGLLADYLVAVNQLDGDTRFGMQELQEMLRSYAAMRFVMAQAVGPRIACAGTDLLLESQQSRQMTEFLQHSIDSLLHRYTPQLTLSVHRTGWWRVRLVLSTCGGEGSDGAASTDMPPGWKLLPGGQGIFRSAGFAAFCSAGTSGSIG